MTGLTSFWIAFGSSAVLAYPVTKGLHHLKARQTVSEHLPEHQKKQGTPTMGGLIFVPAMAIAFALAGQWSFAILALAYGAIGFVDDFVVPRLMPGKRGLGWMQKLALQFALAVPIAWIAVGGELLWVVLGSLAIVMVGNAVNFTDGLDLLASSVMLAMVPALLMLGADQVLLGMVFAGALIPFMFLNAPPAKLFMGDVGSLPLGGLLGLALILSLKESANPIPLAGAFAVLCFVLLAELIPVPLQIASVKLRKGKRLFLRTPIHHAFEAKGWPESRIVWTFFLVQVLATFLAMTIYVGLRGPL